MLWSDAETQPADNLFKNINSINLDVISEVQKDVEPYDMISLVFLLYDTPDTALQKLICYERISRDVDINNMNLLYDWAVYMQNPSNPRTTWKYEFLEALTICRLYNIIRKLGFDVSKVKKHYLPENVYVTIYIDPIKKALYKICENMTFDYLLKFKRTLNSYKIDVSEHNNCEIIFLKLMSNKFIKLGQYDNDTKKYSNNYDIEDLAKIFENISHFKEHAKLLREIKDQINCSSSLDHPEPMSTESTKNKLSLNSYNIQGEKYTEGFDDIFQQLNQLHLEDEPIQSLKSDTNIKLRTDAYALKNRNRIGVCCIINQEVFHPSKDSIQSHTPDLSDRLGSTLDLIALEKTMTALNFDIKSKSNLNNKEVIQFIKNVIREHVHTDDSVFMLCIMSHGVRGHVYAADSTKIKVDNILSLLDSDEASKLHGMPKVLILQACQVEPEPEIKSSIKADGPKSEFYLKKLHFLIYWATAPEYEAYRIEDKGSIFIQCLCGLIKKMAEYEHLSDIFTKVTDVVTTLCTQLQRAQVPIFKSTLRKKLYLK
ncbi:unnamed protein product [Euphydryas editha]|uniref:Caspase-8 n=1 Tax=Euphydryas editha TaxID=104508 RepID=A0AAU9TEY0_EUPED|nr:unnamed protein product [Euphydryas editha]